MVVPNTLLYFRGTDCEVRSEGPKRMRCAHERGNSQGAGNEETGRERGASGTVACTMDGGRRAHRAPTDEFNNRDGGRAIGKHDPLAPAGGDCDCKRPLD